MDIKQTIATINKQYGDDTIEFAKNLKYTNIVRTSSGSLFLDWALGTNVKDTTTGWPLGRIIELYGTESSGKSLIALLSIAEAQKKGIGCAYIDCENAFDSKFAELLGVDLSKLLLSREDIAENVLELVGKLFKADKVKLVVVDSLASMIPSVELEKDLDQHQIAPMAKVMSKGLRKVIALNKNQASVIFINQLRKNPMALYGNPEYTPGGNSLKFYASLRVDVRRGDWIFDVKDKKKKVGQIVKFRVIKNKTDVPMKEGYFKYLYTGKLDPVDELVSIGLLTKVIERRGAYFTLDDNSWQGRESMETKLREDEKMFERAKKLIFEGGE